jgi:glutamate dehydrogenase
VPHTHDRTTDPLLQAYFRHIAPEDLADRVPDDLAGALASHRRLASVRPPGTARVRVHTPQVSAHGWEAHGHSVVEVVTDDMPFLVDSVLMELARHDHDVHLVVHPRFDVLRSASGELQEVAPADERSPAPPGQLRESWMHVEVDRLGDEANGAAALEADLQRVLDDVRVAVEDWPRMREQVAVLVEEISSNPPPVSAAEAEEGRGLLAWLAEDHFTFLGYREYELEGDDVLRSVPGTGLGILREEPSADGSSSFARLPPFVRSRARERALLVLAKANSRATVHRPSYLDYVGVKKFGRDGEVVGERRFLGLWSSAAYTESLRRIPLLAEKADAVLAEAGLDPRSHAGKALLEILEGYPRDELLTVPVTELATVAEAVLQARERRRLRLFVRPDPYRRYLTCLVYLPRDRYNTTVRERFAAILRERLEASSIEFSARVGESPLAQIHFVVRPPAGEPVPEVDVAALEHQLVEAARSWSDDFVGAVTAEFGESAAARLVRTYRNAFPSAYVEDFSPRAAAVDVRRIEAIQGDSGVDLAISERVDAPADELRLTIYRVGEPLTLTAVLPMLASFGVEVVDERPHLLEGLDRQTWIYEFGLRAPVPVEDSDRAPLEEALRAIWAGECEVDGFNGLVLGQGLRWRQVSVLRAYARYLRQAGTPFSLETIEDALRENVGITRLLVALFEARFDPAATAPRAEAEAALRERIEEGLDAVVRLDHDRIIRSYLGLIGATLRTNHFARDGRGQPRPVLAMKLDPGAVPDLPEPRPRFEIFVHSPRVEGVHLRFGAVARGGLRWSDRRDDFRTEVLGLVKAQMVKNTVIVPVGAKGGFYAKQLPDPADREAWMAEGVACYRMFIAGLLDLTDNMVAGEVVPPAGVVRHDGDDAYLVVAADKGTATFSDIANEVAAGYGFWLGDAFASGGSAGYDHKAMGITARGAWVSVQRHFREMGVDCQREEFTCVGIGDMSGDVFGNGLLSSRTARLVAAFDHRDIFLDPTPDAASSYDERERLFALPRSSWQDYDRSLISEGGGVWSRQAKRIPVSPQVAEALGIDPTVGSLPPNDLLKAILRAPVDLLWNGGIGTYVKASTETHADVGDKSNDAIRVDGGDLRVRCVGEGGNLGLTQRGRIEYAVAGGRLNTDFIDNSAGVDTSDREVNLKILLDRAVDEGDLTLKQRNELLASMTDEVAGLVLRDNAEQNLALANAAATSPALLHVHESWIQTLEQQGAVDRELEALPTPPEVRRRLDQGEGLTAPELAVLLSWTKIVLANELLASDLPEDPFLRSDLYAYFPSRIRQDYRQRIEQHPLRREIIVTQVVNDLVNGAGMTFWHRLAEETSASLADLARANFVAREIFGSLALRDRIAEEDNKIDAAVQTSMRIEMRTLVERASRWLVTNRRSPLASEEIVDFFGEAVQRVMADLPDLLGGREREAFEARRDGLLAQGVEEALATRIAVLQPAYVLLGVVETAEREGLDPVEVARVHFALGERLGLSSVAGRVQALPRRDRWEAMARAAVRDDLLAVHTQLTHQVLQATAADESAPMRVALWEEKDATRVQRAAQTLEEICADETADLARVAVGLRVVRGLVT